MFFYLRPHRQLRNRGVTNNLFGVTAEQDRANAASSMRADHDQIGLETAGLFDDMLKDASRVFFHQYAVRLDAAIAGLLAAKGH